MTITNSIPVKWSIGKKLVFCCFFLFTILYTFPFPIGNIPGLNITGLWYSQLWNVLVPWIGEHILSVPYPITVQPNGSGDTTYNYVQLFSFLSLALIGGLIWTIIDRRRDAYPKLLKGLTVFIRYYLGYYMLAYGFAKVIKTQFPFPGLESLITPFGESSPMGLAWKFMGYSEAYNMFTGMGEVVGGLLLFFRRTTLLGSLVLLAVMSNVVMINFSYDVPVKLFSSVLLLFILFIFALDLKRFLHFFLFNKPIEAKNYTAYFKEAKWNIAKNIGKGLLLAYFLFSNISSGLSRQKQYGDKRTLPPLYGIYEVETFVKNQDSIPPLTTDVSRWKRLIISRPEHATIQYMDEHRARYNFYPDTSKQEILTYSPRDTTQKSTLVYQWANDSTLLVDGVFRRDTLSVRLTLKKKEDFLLVNRGFHWINEYPFSR